MRDLSDFECVMVVGVRRSDLRSVIVNEQQFSG